MVGLGWGWIAAAGPWVLTGCSGDPPKDTDTPTDTDADTDADADADADTDADVDTPTGETGQPCGAVTEPFEANTDDEEVRVIFGRGFTFDFYGSTYAALFINSNGGLTFASLGADQNWNVAADDIEVPGIGIFWSDMLLKSPTEITYQQCDDAFLIQYDGLTDRNVPTWRNTATVRLESDGTIEIEYGVVDSMDLLIGVWDGSHDDDTPVPPAPVYTDYPNRGSGLLLFDFWADVTTQDRYNGVLDKLPVTFQP